MNDITKMNLIAIVQQLPNEDIEFIQICITMLEDKITKLQEENKSLKELNVCVGCNNNPDYKSRNEKAIEYIKEKISSTQGVINDYMYHKEHNKILIELLQEDIEMYKKELHILNGGDE